jgi:hypothetical protein
MEVGHAKEETDTPGNRTEVPIPLGTVRKATKGFLK